MLNTINTINNETPQISAETFTAIGIPDKQAQVLATSPLIQAQNIHNLNQTLNMMQQLGMNLEGANPAFALATSLGLRDFHDGFVNNFANGNPEIEAPRLQAGQLMHDAAMATIPEEFEINPELQRNNLISPILAEDEHWGPRANMVYNMQMALEVAQATNSLTDIDLNVLRGLTLEINLALYPTFADALYAITVLAQADRKSLKGGHPRNPTNDLEALYNSISQKSAELKQTNQLLVNNNILPGATN